MTTITPQSLYSVREFRPAEDSAREWLESIERHGRVFGWTRRDQLDVARCRLSHEAQIWDAATAHIDGWDEYKEAFLQRYDVQEEELFSQLATCRQGRNETVRQYADRYRYLAAQLNLPYDEDPSQKYNFLRGLNRWTYKEVYRMRPQSLKEAIEDAIYISEGQGGEGEGHEYAGTVGKGGRPVGQGATTTSKRNQGGGNHAPFVALMETDPDSFELAEIRRQVADLEHPLHQYLGLPATPLYYEMTTQRCPQEARATHLAQDAVTPGSPTQDPRDDEPGAEDGGARNGWESQGYESEEPEWVEEESYRGEDGQDGEMEG